MPSPLRFLAPAKINISLQVTGKRDDGYHLLDSLIVFADHGDDLLLAPAEEFSLTIDGPFANSFTPDEENIISRAMRALEQMMGQPANVHITLTKNLPVGAGLGGGSADAAAAVRALLTHWNVTIPFAEILPLLTSLGADVPVCYISKPAHVIGIGDQFEEVGPVPRLPILLINPLIPCSTARVFSQLMFSEKPSVPVPTSPDKEALFAYMGATSNDMTDAALAIVPEIDACLEELRMIEGTLFPRMSGSGATCFAFFETEQDCRAAAQTLKQKHPHWWVRATSLL